MAGTIALSILGGCASQTLWAGPVVTSISAAGDGSVHVERVLGEDHQGCRLVDGLNRRILWAVRMQHGSDHHSARRMTEGPASPTGGSKVEDIVVMVDEAYEATGRILARRFSVAGLGRRRPAKPGPASGFKGEAVVSPCSPEAGPGPEVV